MIYRCQALFSLSLHAISLYYSLLFALSHALELFVQVLGHWAVSEEDLRVIWASVAKLILFIGII